MSIRSISNSVAVSIRRQTANVGGSNPGGAFSVGWSQLWRPQLRATGGAESSPPLPVTGSTTGAPALASMS
eukprot:6611230-Prymnesium_polylepis.1